MANNVNNNNNANSTNKQFEDMFRILVATDIHLGYNERDPVRGNDSFQTFEEVLQNAKKLKVDFILLGGDFFHDNKPSRKCLHKAMELLREYCFGDSAVEFDILSDQQTNFHTKFGCVNYMDPNFNIELPIFTIHGNHDDPGGDGALSSLDLLNVTGLVNYFGKNKNVDDITVYPILMKKGESLLAIYGFGNVRDERLFRIFSQKKVKMMRPIENQEDWFNLLVLHQNRYPHGIDPKNYVHEQMIDDFLDFVIWGHEHECLIKPQESSIGDFFISQPGSTVATALSEGESKKKHIALLEIKQKKFRLRAIPLETVRPFYIEEVILASEGLEDKEEETVSDFLAKRINQIIKKSEQENPNKMLPLIRLKVDYTGYTTVSPQRFGQRFVGKVANPNDILLFSRKRAASAPKDKSIKENVLQAIRPDALNEVHIEDLIDDFLGNTASNLAILPETEFHGALRNFVEKDDKHAFESFVTQTLRTTRQYLLKETKQDSDIKEIVTQRTAQMRGTKEEKLGFFDQDEINEAKKQLKKELVSDSDVSEDENEDEEDDVIAKKKGTKKGAANTKKVPVASQKAPAPTAKRTSTRGKSAKTTTTKTAKKPPPKSKIIPLIDSDSEDDVIPIVKKELLEKRGKPTLNVTSAVKKNKVEKD